MSSGDIDDICSFCGRGTDDIDFIVPGPPGVAICNECVMICNSIIKKECESPEGHGLELKDIPSPAFIKEKLDEYVIGQDHAKKILAVTVYNHYSRVKNVIDGSQEDDDIELEKSNVLLVGPTGCGKTLLASTLARILEVPFAIADATTLTEAGYVGEDVENVLLKLIRNAEFNIKKAQMGIIYIDEIDKIGRSNQNVSITRDVSGEGVQQAILKLLEGTEANVPPQGGRKHPEQEYLQIETGHILFICGGTFTGIDDHIRRRLGGTLIGFGNETPSGKEKASEDLGDILAEAAPEDFIEYGLIPELVGRLPIVSHLRPLNADDLIRVLTEPRNALTRQYEKLFRMQGKNLVFSPESLRLIAEKAQKSETGTRALRSIIEQIMVEIMFDSPSQPDITEYVITPEVIRNGYSAGRAAEKRKKRSTRKDRKAARKGSNKSA